MKTTGDITPDSPLLPSLIAMFPYLTAKERLLLMAADASYRVSFRQEKDTGGYPCINTLADDIAKSQSTTMKIMDLLHER